MKSSKLRQSYLDFFKHYGHREIPSAQLVPENDSTTLFVSAGMQPLLANILGKPHPQGQRLVNSQKCFRAQDIEEVGDNRHTTFFEMLGNWSLGDYFKEEQLSWFFEFLTKIIGLEPEKLYVSVFDGDEKIIAYENNKPQKLRPDVESISIWKQLFESVGIEAKEGERIFAYPAGKNWWSRSGEPDQMPAGEPGGPDSEVFYDFGVEYKFHENSQFKNEKCHPNCDCGRFLEIGNSVFMEYQKQSDRTLKELAQKTVDFGGGLERLVAATNNEADIFSSDMFMPIIHLLEEASGQTYHGREKTPMRIIADHLKAATFMLSEGLIPGNKQQGYILRRLIRRSVLKIYQLGVKKSIPELAYQICQAVGNTYKDFYKEVDPTRKEFRVAIKIALTKEIAKFERTLDMGMKMF
ncbi:alanine--tRNA ligase, partial [Candidatus Gottesmanbacteria bacterium]|nr:alanine--tRNA ligase [Candidatus Gottesmanbacteria bacterium]